MERPKQRKSDAARRANQVIRSRTVLVMAVLGVATFVVLFWKLYDLQINQHAEMQQLAGIIKYAVMIVSSLPIIIVYPFLQRFFVKGVMIGSIKG